MAQSQWPKTHDDRVTKGRRYPLVNMNSKLLTPIYNGAINCTWCEKSYWLIATFDHEGGQKHCGCVASHVTSWTECWNGVLNHVLSHFSSSLSLSVFLFLILFGCVLTRALHTHSRHALVAFSISLCLLRLNQVPFCCSSRASKLSASGRGRDCYTIDFTNFVSDAQVKLLSLPPPLAKFLLFLVICNIFGSCSV